MYKILILEDDRGIAKAIKTQTEMWGMRALCVQNFRDVMSEFAAYQPHLVLIDIYLPYYNGYHWCRQIRKISSVPIIFVSSASDNMNLVMAMDMGADDFISKPFDQDVLMAKLHALLRRSYDFASKIPLLNHRGAFLNTGDHTLFYKEEKIELSKNEYRILFALMQNKGKTVSREKLMKLLWDSDNFVDDNTLTVNINRLRKKLETVGLEDFIITKFGLGYIIG